MKIAIPTNDRINIAVRTGRAKEFAIYEVENNEVKEVQYVLNTHKHDDEHHHDHGYGHGHGHGHEHNHGSHSHREIIDLLKGIDILLICHIGKYFKAEITKADITYKMVKGESLKEIIDTYLVNL